MYTYMVTVSIEKGILLNRALSTLRYTRNENGGWLMNLIYLCPLHSDRLFYLELCLQISAGCRMSTKKRLVRHFIEVFPEFVEKCRLRKQFYILH